MDEIIKEGKKEKIKKWLKDKHNLTFIGILILAIIIRLYYFSITKSQPLWWDEADYLAYAKNLAGFNVAWTITSAHNSLLPYLAAILLKFGLYEEGCKFIFSILPSIAVVLLTYYASREMYKEKSIALIAAFLMAVLWESLFYSMRFHVEMLSLSFGLLSIYVFWKGHEKKEKIFGRINHNWAMPLVSILVALTYSVRRGYFLFGVFFFIYLILTKKWRELLKDKFNWVSVGIFIVLFFIIENTIFLNKISGAATQYFHFENAINFLPLGSEGFFSSVFAAYFINIAHPWASVLLYLFWAGFLMICIEIIMSFGYLKKLNKENYVLPDIFNILAIVITLAFFITILRTPDSLGEARWYYPLLFSAIVCVSRATAVLKNKLHFYHKKSSIIVILVILIFSGYYQISHADGIIRNKIESYRGIKEASIYVRELSSESDIIITRGQPQVEYYAERKTVNPQNWAGAELYSEGLVQQHFEATLAKIKETQEAKYLLISFIEPGYPEWMKKIHETDGRIVAWEIPFMNTKIDFVGQQQDIKKSVTYGDITFSLLEIKGDVFVYKISIEKETNQI